MINAYTILVEDTEGTALFDELDVDGRIVSDWIL
jgi:hypothetical protein